jgi:hypothetical protein
MPHMTTQASLFAALLFIIISSQPVYKITNSIFSKVGLRLADSAGNPTRAGLVVHALVFFAAMYGYARMNKI